MERLTDNKINGWTFEETVGTAKNLMEAEKICLSGMCLDI